MPMVIPMFLGAFDACESWAAASALAFGPASSAPLKIILPKIRGRVSKRAKDWKCILFDSCQVRSVSISFSSSSLFLHCVGRYASLMKIY
jgi:hypothetical protein